MSLMLRSLIVFATITCGAYQVAEGQIVRRALSKIFCYKCNRYDCGCAQPVLTAHQPDCCVPPPTQSVGGPVAQSCTKTCTTVHPVVETRYRKENYTTCRTECRTAYRQEAFCETVPTTCVENVTRDEGCYQMVWVPKPVTRQVAKTVYQQRTNYRTVPYQYTVQVPELKCRVVPEQRVRYVQKTQTFCEPMKPLCPPPAPNCAVPNCAAPGLTPQTYPQAAQDALQGQTATPWTNVPQRSADQQAAQGSNYYPVSAAAQQPTTGTPTAAAVWQTPR